MFCLTTGKSIIEKAITTRAFTAVGMPAALKIGSMKRMTLRRSRIAKRTASSKMLTLNDSTALSHKVWNADDDLAQKPGKLPEHPGTEEQQREKGYDDLGHESHRHFLDLGDRLKNADHNSDDHAKTKHGKTY
jgi:hypothetical protein